MRGVWGKQGAVAVSLMVNTTRETQLLVNSKSATIELDGFFDVPQVPTHRSAMVLPWPERGIMVPLLSRLKVE